MGCFLHDKRILITGSSGFVGGNLMHMLNASGWDPIGSSSKIDNLTDPNDVNALFEYAKPDVVFHLAGKVGGIKANRESPAEFYTQNTLINTLVIDAAYRYGVQKLITLGAGCGYPAFLNPPFKESDLWKGFPDDSSYAYSLSKRNVIVQCRAYKEQFGFDSTVILPPNVYGPWDHFNTDGSHVVPALIKRFCDAVDEGKDIVELWGAGNATREFIYVEDLCKLMLNAVDYPEVGPINVGNEEEVSIRELAMTIAAGCGYEGKIVFSQDGRDGQNRRVYDCTYAKQTIARNFQYTDLVEGLNETIRNYREYSELHSQR